jgi:hypothetical protein
MAKEDDWKGKGERKEEGKERGSTFEGRERRAKVERKEKSEGKKWEGELNSIYN